MLNGITVQDMQRNVEAANALFDVMQQYNLEFVIRDHEGERFIDVHAFGCDKLLGGSRDGLSVASAERIYNSNAEMLGEMLSR